MSKLQYIIFTFQIDQVDSSEGWHTSTKTNFSGPT